MFSLLSSLSLLTLPIINWSLVIKYMYWSPEIRTFGGIVHEWFEIIKVTVVVRTTSQGLITGQAGYKR